MTLRMIDPGPMRGRYQGPQSEPGKRPELRWLKIKQLRIDPRYQREIGERGARNVLEIAHHFKWNKFSIVVVAPIGGDLYAIVDGQHHTTSAALRGFDEVPCVIIEADESEQADSFVAINANVTAMSPLQLHAARLAAGNSTATLLTKVCKEAGVAICRYPVPANKIKPGETLAVAMLHAALEKYGRDVLIAALSCITQTRKGNPGMIRQQIVSALCAVLEAERELLKDVKALIFRMQTFDFAGQFNTARARSIETGEKVTTLMIDAISGHLEPEAAPAPAAPTRQQPGKVPVASPVRVLGGLTIGREDVSRGGQSVRVGPRAALLVAALAKAKPNCVGDEFLISKIWTSRPTDAVAILDQLMRELSSLKKLGIEVRTQRGVGRQLVDLEA